MAVLEGMDKILNIINKFLEDYDITAYWNEDFEAVCDENKIGFTLAPTQEDLNYFMNDAQSRYSFVQADPMLWLLFHEVGHIMTNDQWTVEELEYFEYQKEQMSYIEDDQMRNDWYHALPDEFAATRWAAFFMYENKEKVQAFWEELQPAILEFYFTHELSNDED